MPEENKDKLLGFVEQVARLDCYDTGHTMESGDAEAALSNLIRNARALIGLDAGDSKHPIFFRGIRHADDLAVLFGYLVCMGLSYHPEDPAGDCLGRAVTKSEADALDQRMREAYALSWPKDDCPCRLLALIEARLARHPVSPHDIEVGSYFRGVHQGRLSVFVANPPSVLSDDPQLTATHLEWPNIGETVARSEITDLHLLQSFVAHKDPSLELGVWYRARICRLTSEGIHDVVMCPTEIDRRDSYLRAFVLPLRPYDTAAVGTPLAGSAKIELRQLISYFPAVACTP